MNTNASIYMSWNYKNSFVETMFKYGEIADKDLNSYIKQ